VGLVEVMREGHTTTVLVRSLMLKRKSLILLDEAELAGLCFLCGAKMSRAKDFWYERGAWVDICSHLR
jgi:hypothetical protein